MFVISEVFDPLLSLDSDSSDNPRKRQKKRSVMPVGMLPPPNRIFVFSTELANRAAEAVTQGRVSSIVAYHRAQPQNQHFLRLHRSNPPDYMMNHSAVGGINPYRYGNYPGHVSKMEGMFSGKPRGMAESQMSGRQGVPTGGMGSGLSSMHQYQQYLKQQQQQQQQQQEARPSMSGVDEIQQMLYGPVNGGTKGMFPPSTVPDAVGEPSGPRPPYGYSGHVPPGFRQQSMFMNSQREERFKFPQQQSFPNVTSQQQQQQQQQAQLHQQPQQSFSTSQPSTQQPHLPVLSPSSSASSSSPLSSNIRSPPPYPAPRGAEANTLPGGSTVVGAPSPTNASSPHTPQTPHAPLTPRLSTSLASPKDGQRSPFSPGSVSTSSTFSAQASVQQNIRDSGMKHPSLARQSPSLEKPELTGDKGIPSFGIMSDSRGSFTVNSRQEGAQRPNSLDISRDNHDTQRLPPPNKSPFLPSSSPISLQPNPMGDSSTSHHPSKSFSVESLTAPSEKERFFRAPLSVQAAPPYAAYSQQPGLYYAGNKFPPSMLSQGQYQYPGHIQSTPQQFFPPNLPPNMYLPHSTFPIHHAGNREGGL